MLREEFVNERSEFTNAGEVNVSFAKQTEKNLSPLTFHFSHERAAFTLAETLITLGIIGVVAAITMPSVIQNYKKQEAVTRLKKAYSIVENLLTLSELDNGPCSDWKMVKGHDFFETYIKNYVKYLKEYSSSELWELAPRKLLNGSDYNGSNYSTWTSAASAHFMLIDGTMITLNKDDTHPDEGINIAVGIDINGLKKPNQLGKDTFLFAFSTKYGLQPCGGSSTLEYMSYGEYDRSKILGTSNSYACNKKKSGYWCSAVIMNDGWKISDDYPW